MDVTRKNFFTLLPDIKKAVNDADFITFDLEFTGLTSGGKDLEAMPFDTPRLYYEKIYQRALDFLPLQLGACIFQYDSEKERYMYQAFNFYVFPFSKLRGFPNCTFQCQSSSLAFLSSCGFDFNKAIGEGIPYLTQIEEDKLRYSIKERQQKISSKESADIPVPDDQKVLLNVNLKKIRDFIEDQSSTRQNSIILDRCYGFMRRLLYQEVPKEFGDAVQLETCEDLDFSMRVIRDGGEELKKKREEEKKEKEWKELDEAIGLSHFVKLISESGKLVIGHNCLLDLCHLVNRFRHPLPSDYDTFKELLHDVFPKVLDTKFMSTANEFKDIILTSGLGHLLETLSEAPFEMPIVEGNVEGRSYSNLVDKSHEGGYDAYITGQCFLSMCQYLAKKSCTKFAGVDSISNILGQFENRLYLMRIQDVRFMRLGGQDLKPPRNHVFHLKFPREWRQNDVVELFKPFGPVFVFFIDDRSAFVALHKRDQAKLVLKTMTESNIYKVTTFAAYQKQCERNSPPPPLSSRGSPSREVVRKRKIQEPANVPETLSVFKKHCNLEQPSTYAKRSIEPIPEEAETEGAGGNGSLESNDSKKTKLSQEFPESDVWD